MGLPAGQAGVSAAGRFSTGFTLIEVMIVLAISSLLAVILITLYGSQQGRAQFADATESVVSKLQSVKTEVNSGFSTGSGNMKERIFFGKAVVFAEGSQEYTVYTLTADNADTLSGLEYVDGDGNGVPDVETVKIPWGVSFAQADSNLNTIIFTRNLSNAQLKTYIFSSGMNILTPNNYNIPSASQATLRFIEDEDNPQSFRSNVVVEAASAHIRSNYEN